MNRLWPAVLVLAAATAACTSSEDMTLLHREITDVQRQVQELEESMPDKGDLDQMEQRLQGLTSQTMRSNADLAMRVERLQEQIEALHASLELTTRRLETISQELAAARSAYATGAVLPPVTAAPNVGSDSAGPEGPRGAPIGAVPVPVSPATATPEELYRSA
jgi:peptidoglycan hydrolase CwlO-like protein